MKKHYKEWLRSLDVYDEYLANLNPRHREVGDNISAGFVWGCSTEGYGFWKKVYAKIYAFENLIKRVEEVSHSAAKYLKKEAWKRDVFTLAGDITEVMNCSTTPQGQYYWIYIITAIEAKEKK